MFRSRLDRIVQRALRTAPGDWTWSETTQSLSCREVNLERLRSGAWVFHTSLGNVVLSSRSGRKLDALAETCREARLAA